MRKKTRKIFTQEDKSLAITKARALERESNITLVSTAVAIVSFFILLYSHSALTANYSSGLTIINVTNFILVIAAFVCAVFAVWKKKKFLWEYVVFCLIMSIGYYLLPRGVAGIPGLISESSGTVSISPLATKLSAIITTKNVAYGLWAVNLLYCLYAIVFHSVKYSKIKKGSNK